MNTIPTVHPHDTLAVLRAAREWLGDPDRWTTDIAWRDCNDSHAADRESVAKTCALGALMLTTVSGVAPDAAQDALRRALGTHSIVEVNDEYADGYARILAGFDAAIAELEATP